MRTPSVTNVVASYTVLPGDTVPCIAMYHGTTTRRLCELNKKRDCKDIHWDIEQEKASEINNEERKGGRR